VTGNVTPPATQPLGQRVCRAVLVVTINLVLTLALIEIMLRAQQAFGPLYDLDVNSDASAFGLSDELNHTFLPTETAWNADGIRQMHVPNSVQCKPKLLFMGDSFMQGLGIDDTIPVHVRGYLHDALHRNVCVANAGASSYSPSIYVPQAKKLIPKVKPDIVIIDVDETDLWDDYYRYRHLVVRDASGSIVAVRRTPLAEEFRDGLAAAGKKPLYLQRLAAKLNFTKIVYPRLSAEYRRNMQQDGFWASRASIAEARQRYGAAIAYFAATLQDLTETVTRLMGSPQDLIYIHHPHLENLRTTGEVFNSVVSDTIRDVASRNKVRCYDATDDLKIEFGAEPERYYIPNDMHFNERGLKAYSLSVAKYLATIIPGD
jgi:hypothetical protein